MLKEFSTKLRERSCGEEEYIKKVENNLIREDCISPYIRKKIENRQKQLKSYGNKKEWKFCFFFFSIIKIIYRI